VKKILIIDDDLDLLRLMKVAFEKEGFTVLTTTDGSEGLAAAFQHHPDVVLLDVMMPKVNGWETCRRLRELSHVPIVMVTAKTAEKDVVKGLALGADDYVCKPFSLSELVARVQACLRRSQSPPSVEKSAVLVSGPLTIDVARREVTVRGDAVKLTPTEFRLLCYLARNQGQVVEHRRLLREVWGPEYGDELDYLRLYVSYLRRKIEKNPARPEIIKTAWGEGYYVE
jgi:two-component system KDP operon response regulator KdpE